MGRRALCILVMLGFSHCCFAAKKVYWTCSTNSARWVDKGSFDMVPWTSQSLYLEALPDSQRQEITGFGGCFNELEWTALNKLSAAGRDSVMKALFDTVTGCRFNMGRMPIGANDYSLNYYSHDDSTGDYDMSGFTIARHLQYVIPFIKEAMKLRPDLKMWGSPWTPPAWMKTNSNYAHGSLTWDAQTLTAYALYFEKAVYAYQAQGLNFFAVFVQNEPYADNIYPTCLWTGTQLHDFVKLYLGPLFRRDAVPAQIWLSTINNASFSSAVAPSLDDSVTRGYLGGVGYQYEGLDAMPDHYRLYPQVPFWQTETECGSAVNDWSYAESQFDLRKKSFDAGGAAAYFEWNMVLETRGMSSWNWAQCAMISIDTARKTVTYNPHYHLTKHFSYFVKPHARSIRMAGSYGDKVGFLNPDGSAVLVVRNNITQDLVTGIKIDNDMFLPTIPGKSFNTFLVTGVRPPLVRVSGPPACQGRFTAYDANGAPVYDMAGRLVCTINRTGIPDAGAGLTRWVVAAHGGTLKAGIYIVKLRSGVQCVAVR